MLPTDRQTNSGENSTPVKVAEVTFLIITLIYTYYTVAKHSVKD